MTATPPNRNRRCDLDMTDLALASVDDSALPGSAAWIRNSTLLPPFPRKYYAKECDLSLCSDLEIMCFTTNKGTRFCRKIARLIGDYVCCAAQTQPDPVAAKPTKARTNSPGLFRFRFADEGMSPASCAHVPPWAFPKHQRPRPLAGWVREANDALRTPAS